MKFPKRLFLETKLLSFSTLGIIVLVILSVWLSGQGSHRSLFLNSILSTSILAGAFFLFISLGLYYGLKLKENVGNVFNKERLDKYAEHAPAVGSFDFDPPAVGDSIAAAILSVVLWFVLTVVLVVLLYFLGFLFWAAVLFLIAMLYWIFFRALRLVFKNSGKCKGNLLKSLGFGIFYSFLYISWIYGIIFLANYINS
ncbi:hypothetical protein JET18_08720 [Chryseobacterium sp. L7]|uniref:G-protein coupled receptors family 3 profile domain-containing protein n=1 Tax=Chryseobacterium endalhagicum TaxID=2797638 RepID=A0ABS1QF49_9FLAO|nr:hypothetical protein [Chryseobacterium endalhagicum]MBL1220917.1 hypothetical protein [Chryseobacterium endalhagicum]